MATYEVTLKDLRQAKACIAGYNKVVCSLQGQPFTDEHRDMKSYIRFVYKEPISLSFILENNGLNDALWALHCIKDADRDIRLFSVWCARQVQHLMIDSRSTNALDVAERFANGKATKEELEAAHAAAWDANVACPANAANAASAASAAWNAACAASAGWAANAASAARAACAASAGWAARAASAARAACAASAGWAARAASAGWADTYAAQEEMFKLMCDGKAPWQTQG